ncbi:T9SS type B sorting domain-containing protein, partial [Dokdonia sp.]|uniref:T9SS type B sorting domain-containing protein n=2 Tax=Dokdonia sp. TaxID=2024995 RepID=UPI0032669683
PMPNLDPDPYELCDDDADGIMVFDLTTQESQILDGLDPAIFTITWFVDQTAADAGMPVIPDPTSHTSNTNTVIAVVTDVAQSTTTFCSQSVILDLIVNPLPTPIQPALYELCDDIESGSDTDEFSTFDLRSRDDEITGANPDWVVSYHLTEAEADAGTPTLTDLYQNAVPASQTVWVRVEDVVTGCYDLITLTLAVNQLPSPTVIDPIEVCDDDFDGIAIFDLTDPVVTAGIFNGETNFSLSFHETLAAAELGTPAIADPANYASVSRTIYVRATDTDPATSTVCFRVIEIELVVNPIPLITLPLPDLTECNDGTDQVIFDLTQNETAVLGGLDPLDYTLTYHEQNMDALDDVFPIGDPVNYLVTAPGTIIWVRLENIATECASVAPFNATIAPIPVFTAPPAILEACDSEGPLVGTDDDGITFFDLTSLDAGITAGDLTLTVTYYESQADLDAGNFITPADAYVNTGAVPQTIFIQISSTAAGMCMAQTTVDLIVNPLPFIPEPLAVSIACDDDNDGFADFDLQSYNDDLLASLTGINLRFYETFDNAQLDDGTGLLDISLPYNNITGMAQLYLVAEDTTTGCTKIYSFDLLVFPMPDLPLSADLDPLTECDTDGDGFEQFNLTDNEAAILINIPLADQGNFIVTYHTTEADAENGVAAIPTPTAYTNVNMNTVPDEIIWVRVETNDGSANNCHAVTSFNIVVEALPVINPAGVDLNMVVCNDDSVADDPLGVVVFDLTLLETDITGGDDLLDVVYYASLADLASDTPIVDPDMYTNILNPQTIQVVVTSLAGCSSQTTFDIEVLPLPSPGTPDNVELCDDDLDGDDTNGIVEFDLTQTVTVIEGGEPVTVSIFDDLTLAEATPFDAMDIVTTIGVGGEILYTNTIPGGQTLYARVDSTTSILPDGTACFVIVPFDVIVNPLPILVQDTPYDYTFCEEFDGDDTMGEVDLMTLADDAGFLVAPQNTADFTISYHNTAIEAENTAFPIDQSVLFTVTDGDEIFFRVENTTTGCASFGSVIFTVETRPEANPADDITQCADDPGINGIPVQDVSTFDLTQQNDVITGGEATTSVVYYTSLVDAQNMENEILDPTAFVNTSDPQTIYARAINTASMCESTAVIEFMLFVEPLPFTDLSDEGGEICVDEQTGESLEPFLLDGSVEDPILDEDSYAYTWTRDGVLVSLEPTVLVDQQGEYEVTITATYDNGAGVITSCDYVANTSYVAVSAPVFTAEVVESSFNPGGLYTVEVTYVSAFNSSPEDFEYAIDDGPFQSGTTFTGVSPGEHTVFGRRISGECSISEVVIGIIDYPRFLTPNADGFHDTWNIIGIGVAPNLNAKIYIFDRFGKLIKQLSPTSEGWDGTFNGQPLQSDDYWFRVNFTEPDGEFTQREFVGHFTLKR